MSGAWNLGDSKALSSGGERVRQWWSHRNRASLALQTAARALAISFSV